MIRLPAAIAAAGLRGRMLLQVHDELLFEAPEAGGRHCFAALVRDVMQRCRRAVRAAGGGDRQRAQAGRRHTKPGLTFQVA